MPSRTQITRHDCVEGWSAIGKWKGVPLSALLEHWSKPKPEARYVVFHCADPMEAATAPSPTTRASTWTMRCHPQTILAYDLNDKTLPVPNGAPIRVRVERQLGYKMAKYVMRIELVESFDEHRAAARAATGRTRATSGTPESEFAGSRRPLWR